MALPELLEHLARQPPVTGEDFPVYRKKQDTAARIIDEMWAKRYTTDDTPAAPGSSVLQTTDDVVLQRKSFKLGQDSQAWNRRILMGTLASTTRRLKPPQQQAHLEVARSSRSCTASCSSPNLQPGGQHRAEHTSTSMYLQGSPQPHAHSQPLISITGIRVLDPFMSPASPGPGSAGGAGGAHVPPASNSWGGFGSRTPLPLLSYSNASNLGTHSPHHHTPQPSLHSPTHTGDPTGGSPLSPASAQGMLRGKIPMLRPSPSATSCQAGPAGPWSGPAQPSTRLGLSPGHSSNGGTQAPPGMSRLVGVPAPRQHRSPASPLPVSTPLSGWGTDSLSQFVGFLEDRPASSERSHKA